MDTETDDRRDVNRVLSAALDGAGRRARWTAGRCWGCRRRSWPPRRRCSYVMSATFLLTLAVRLKANVETMSA